MGWLATPIWSGGGSATPKAKTNFFPRFALRGGRTTHVGHGGGSATLKGKTGKKKKLIFAWGGRAPPRGLEPPLQIFFKQKALNFFILFFKKK
jgi:hypothetical protein